MKNVLTTTLAAGALVAIATPASAAEWHADYRALNYEAAGEADQYAVGVDTGQGWLRYGAEVEQTVGDVGDTTQARVNGGVDVAAPFDITLSPRVELGYRFDRGAGDDTGFWGVGVGASRELIGPINGEVSYRYRDAFDGDYSSQRVTAGVNTQALPNLTVGVGYVRDWEANYDGLALSLRTRL